MFNIFITLIFLFAININVFTQDEEIEFDKFLNNLSENISNNYTQSLKTCDSLLAICLNKNYKQQYAELLRLKGRCYFYAVNYSEALKLFISSKESFTLLNDTNGITKANNMIAIVYDYLNLSEKSLEIDKENLELRKKINDSTGIAITLNNIGVHYKNKEKYDIALKYYLDALKFVTMKDIKSLILYKYNIGNVYTLLNNFDSAKYYLNKALLLVKKVNDKQLLMNVLQNFGELYFKKGNYKLARSYQEQSLKIAQQINILYEIESITHDLSHTYEKLRLFNKAYYMLMLNRDARDSIKIDESARIIKEYEMNRYFEKEIKIKEYENEKFNLKLQNQLDQEKNNKIILLILLISIFIIFIIVFVSLFKKKKQNILLMKQQEEIIAQKEEIQAQSYSLEKQRDELEHINNEKDKFFSIIAHDLKSPFAGFLGLTKILAEENENLTKEEVIESGKNLRESAINLFKLLENLLEWSRIQRGVTDFNPELCFLDFLVTQNINIQSEVARQKNIIIINKIEPEIKVLADIPMLNTILRNLLSNALKFTPRNGKIDIGYSLITSTFIEIYVKDNGIGIDNDTIDKLFKIDEKISRPGTENEPSSGLGLLLIKEFIIKNQGNIRVESEVNRGTTFYFTLPITN